MNKVNVALAMCFFSCGLLINNISNAQQAHSAQNEIKVKRLYIGDTVPEVILSNMRNYNGTVARLSDFKGKCIILDFWNKYCTTCISAMPHMEELQNEFKNDLQILLVTNNSMDEVKSLFEKSIILKNVSLPMVFENETLRNQLFPHYGEPYHVWIDRNGVVKATTSSYATTSENIKDLIDGKPLRGVPVRTDYMDEELNYYTSLLTANNGRYLKYLVYYKAQEPIDDHMSKDESVPASIGPSSPYYSLIMKKIDGYIASVFTLLIDSTNKKTIGIRISQQNVPDLYLKAYNAPPRTKIVIEGNQDNYFEPDGATPIELSNWRKENRFQYELKLPNYTEEKMRDIMKSDLQNVWGMNGKWEIRGMPSLVLYRISKDDRLHSKGGPRIIETKKEGKGLMINNMPYDGFLNCLYSCYSKKDSPIVIDETGLDGAKPIDMIINSSLLDIHKLQMELQKYGLGLKEEIRMQKVLVVSKQ